jgi:hypothetical protein
VPVRPAFVALALLLPNVTFAAPKFKNPDDKRAWKESGWGTSPLEDMKCLAGIVPETQTCTRAAATNDRKVGELTMDAVIYYYFQSRLYRVDVMTNSDDAASELATALRTTYGEGHWDAREGREAWKGDQTSIGFQRTVRKTGGIVSYQYLPLLRDVDAAVQKSGGERLKGIGTEL